MRSKGRFLIPVLATLLPVLFLIPSPPAQSAALLKSVLSPAGQVAYESATVGSYFSVSSADYGAAFSGLTDMTKIGISDAIISGCSGGGWSAGYLTVTSSSINIPANAYIVGFASSSTGSSTTKSNIRLASSSTYKGTYNWLTLSTAPVGTTGAKYFLFRSPATSASPQYLGIWGSTAMCSVNQTFAAGGYSTSGPPFTSFTNYTSDSIALQVIYSTSDQWANTPPTVALSVAGNVTKVVKGNSIQVTATTSDEGLVTFRYNNKNIGGCVGVKTSSSSAICNWKPAVQGAGSVTATLRSPTSAFSATISTPVRVTVTKRLNTR